MGKTLIVNYGEYKFTNFDNAVSVLEEEKGYEGEAWDIVTASNDLYVLCGFLRVEGVDAEIV